MDRYYYQTESASFGPMSWLDLWRAGQAGKFGPSDYVLVVGKGQWRRAETLAGVFDEVEPPTDDEAAWMRLIESQKASELAEAAAIRNVEATLLARNAALERAGRTPAIQPPYALDTDYPGSEFSTCPVEKPRVTNVSSSHRPRSYPMIQFGIGLLQAIGYLGVTTSLMGMIYSATISTGLPIFISALGWGVGSLFQFVIAAVLEGYLDLLSDIKRTADGLQAESTSNGSGQIL